MANEILDDRLNRSLLDWPTRYKIAVDITKLGMLFTSQLCPLIIHRNMKSSNILLDEEFSVKLVHFGLCKTFRGTNYKVESIRVVTERMLLLYHLLN